MTMMIHAFATIVLLCILEARGDSSDHYFRWSVQRFPDPRRNYQACDRFEKSWICDPNGVILERHANELNGLLNDVYEDTVCPCSECEEEKKGYPIMVAIVPQMERLINRSNALHDMMVDARIFAYYLSQRFKFGICQDALILIVYIRDLRIAYTLTRSRARAVLTDELISEVTLNAWDYFQANRKNTIGLGLLQMVQDYKNILLNRYQPVERRTPAPQRSYRRKVNPYNTGSLFLSSGSTTVLLVLLSIFYSISY